MDIEPGRQVVLVAGASSGVGRQVASELHGRGHVVFGTSRDAARVDIAGVTPVALEVTDEKSVRACVEEVVRQAGRIDAVLYSAGFYVAGAAEETSPELAFAQLDAYLVGAHRLVRAVLPTMRGQGAGRVLLMSSTAAVSAIPFHSLYSASKAALNHYAEALSYEVEPFGIGVACIEATSVQTGAAAAARISEPLAAYESPRSRVVARFRQSQVDGPAPTAMARVIVHAIEARRLRPKYRIGLKARSLPALRTVLPVGVFRRLYGRFFGLRAEDLRRPTRH